MSKLPHRAVKAGLATAEDYGVAVRADVLDCGDVARLRAEPGPLGRRIHAGRAVGAGGDGAGDGCVGQRLRVLEGEAGAVLKTRIKRKSRDVDRAHHRMMTSTSQHPGSTTGRRGDGETGIPSDVKHPSAPDKHRHCVGPSHGCLVGCAPSDKDAPVLK